MMIKINSVGLPMIVTLGASLPIRSGCIVCGSKADGSSGMCPSHAREFGAADVAGWRAGVAEKHSLGMHETQWDHKETEQ